MGAALGTDFTPWACGATMLGGAGIFFGIEAGTETAGFVGAIRPRPRWDTLRHSPSGAKPLGQARLKKELHLACRLWHKVCPSSVLRCASGTGPSRRVLHAAEHFTLHLTRRLKRDLSFFLSLWLEAVSVV